MLGQRRGRIIFRDDQARAHLLARMADEGRRRRAVLDYIEGWYNTRRLHSSTWIPQPHSNTKHSPPRRRHSGGMIDTSNLSVEADQVH